MSEGLSVSKPQSIQTPQVPRGGDAQQGMRALLPASSALRGTAGGGGAENQAITAGGDPANIDTTYFSKHASWTTSSH